MQNQAEIISLLKQASEKIKSLKHQLKTKHSSSIDLIYLVKCFLIGDCDNAMEFIKKHIKTPEMALLVLFASEYSLLDEDDTDEENKIKNSFNNMVATFNMLKNSLYDILATSPNKDEELYLLHMADGPAGEVKDMLFLSEKNKPTHNSVEVTIDEKLYKGGLSVESAKKICKTLEKLTDENDITYKELKSNGKKVIITRYLGWKALRGEPATSHKGKKYIKKIIKKFQDFIADENIIKKLNEEIDNTDISYLIKTYGDFIFKIDDTKIDYAEQVMAFIISIKKIVTSQVLRDELTGILNTKNFTITIPIVSSASIKNGTTLLYKKRKNFETVTNSNNNTSITISYHSDDSMHDAIDRNNVTIHSQYHSDNKVMSDDSSMVILQNNIPECFDQGVSALQELLATPVGMKELVLFAGPMNNSDSSKIEMAKFENKFNIYFWIHHMQGDDIFNTIKYFISELRKYDVRGLKISEMIAKINTMRWLFSKNHNGKIFNNNYRNDLNTIIWIHLMTAYIYECATMSTLSSHTWTICGIDLKHTHPLVREFLIYNKVDNTAGGVYTGTLDSDDDC